MIVLHVDPDNRSRRQLRTFLENRDVTVTEAEGPVEAREVSTRVHPSAIVTEMFGDAEETIAHLRDVARAAPVLVWTASRDPDVEGRIRRTGWGFLRKPALPSEVAFALGRVSPPGRPLFPPALRPPIAELTRRNRQRSA